MLSFCARDLFGSFLIGLILSSIYLTSAEDFSATESPSEFGKILELDILSAAELARERVEAVMAAQIAVEASQEDGRADLAFAYPQLRVNGSYTRNQELSTIPFGPFGEIETGRRNDYRGMIHAEQLLWSFGKLSATRDLADANTSIANAALKAASRDAAHRARVGVTNVLFFRAQLQVARERVSQRREEREDAQDLRQAGIVNELDVRQASINLIRAEDALKAIEANFKQAHLELAAALALTPESFTVEGELTRPQKVSHLIATAGALVEVGSDMANLSARYQAQDAEYRELNAETLPELRAVADASKDGEDVDNLQDAWSVGLNLTWDLYSGGVRRAQKAAAANRMRELHYRKRELIRERRSQLDKLEVDLNALDKRISEEQRAVNLAAENYQDARDQYRAGLITLTRLGETSLAVAEARFRYVSLFRDEQLAVNELLRLME